MIRFNLRPIVKQYKLYHNNIVTNSDIANKIGIPKRSLSYLISKHPKEIKFDTLAKLVKFFRIPVSHFFNNITDKITVSLSAGVPNFDKAYQRITNTNSVLKKELNKKILLRSTLINVKVNKRNERMYYIAIPQVSSVTNYSKSTAERIFNRHIFDIFIFPISKDVSLSNQVLYKFEKNLNVAFLRYINTRIIAQSGLLTSGMFQDNSEIIPIVLSNSDISMSKSSSARPLNRKYLNIAIRTQNSKGALLLDYTKSYYRN